MLSKLSSTTKKQILFGFLAFIAYTLFINWQTAILLIIGIGFHEYGHLWAARKMGLKTKGFYLLPFIGGLALVNEPLKTYHQKAYIAILGPIFGCIQALAAYTLYIVTQNAVFGEATLWLAFFNLFNLLPFIFLDGGQIVDSITSSINRDLGLLVKLLSAVVGVPLMILWNFPLGLLMGYFSYISLREDVSYYLEKRKVLKMLPDLSGEEIAIEDQVLLKRMGKLETVIYIATYLLLGYCLMLLMYHGGNGHLERNVFFPSR